MPFLLPEDLISHVIRSKHNFYGQPLCCIGGVSICREQASKESPAALHVLVPRCMVRGHVLTRCSPNSTSLPWAANGTAPRPSPVPCSFLLYAGVMKVAGAQCRREGRSTIALGGARSFVRLPGNISDPIYYVCETQSAVFLWYMTPTKTSTYTLV